MIAHFIYFRYVIHRKINAWVFLKSEKLSKLVLKNPLTFIYQLKQRVLTNIRNFLKKFEFFCIGNGGSGGPYITGWIIALFPYLTAGSKNRYLFENNWKDPWNKSYSSGLNTSSFKYHMNQIPFIWNYLGTEIKMLFVGGLVGVVSEKDKSLLPIKALNGSKIHIL